MGRRISLRLSEQIPAFDMNADRQIFEGGGSGTVGKRGEEGGFYL